MKNTTLRALPSILMASLIAMAGAAQAQTYDAQPAMAEPLTKAQIRAEAQGRDGASATTASPGRAGEASTMVRGVPNANPDAPQLTKSKSEIKAEKAMIKARRAQERELAAMGHKGAQDGAEAGTPQISPAGNPSVFKGGTPK